MKLSPTQRGLRLASGIVLFVYVAGHFLNHALGLISLGAAERGLRIAVDVWQSHVGTIVLYGCLAMHVALAFTAIYQRRTLRLPARELLRLVAGLSIPTLLIGHAVSTRVALELYGHPTDYAHVVWMLWHSGREGRQIALLVPGWLHGCLGLNFVLSSRPWFPRYRLALFAAALLLPVLAVLGFFSMLKEVSVLAQSASWVATTIRPMNDARHHGLDIVHNRLLILYGSAIVAVFAARLLRTFIEERRGTLVSIAFPHRTVRVPLGWSVLEASRAHHIDHVSMCGGQARCSTCRVRVTAGEEHCPPPLENERRTLTRVRVPQGIRLACQLRPRADVAVVPLVSPATQVPADAAVHAEEQQVAIALVKFWWDAPPIGLLPHDLLHALDRFNRTTGDTLRASGGTPVEFADNQVVVLFGLDVAATEAAQGALLAAARLNDRLNALGQELHRELGCSAHHVIHLHYGVAVVGETGDQLMRTRTAMGGAIEVIRQLASREQLRSRNAPLSRYRIVVSRALLGAARRDTQTWTWRELKLADGTCIEYVRLDSDHTPRPEHRAEADSGFRL